jgi:hypothetical protein
MCKTLRSKAKLLPYETFDLSISLREGSAGQSEPTDAGKIALAHPCVTVAMPRDISLRLGMLLLSLVPGLDFSILLPLADQDDTGRKDSQKQRDKSEDGEGHGGLILGPWANWTTSLPVQLHFERQNPYGFCRSHKTKPAALSDHRLLISRTSNLEPASMA